MRPGGLGMRAVGWSLRCYPAWWRERYGVEQEELAEELAREGRRPWLMAGGLLAGSARSRLTGSGMPPLPALWPVRAPLGVQRAWALRRQGARETPSQLVGACWSWPGSCRWRGRTRRVLVVGMVPQGCLHSWGPGTAAVAASDRSRSSAAVGTSQAAEVEAATLNAAQRGAIL